MPFVFHPEARIDLQEAFDWYETRREGLGRELLRSVDVALNAIKENPFRFPVVHGETRRALIHRFPYGVYFMREGERFIVLAVYHASRNPRAWQTRNL